MTQNLLNSREKNYGNYHTMANLSQTLNAIVLKHYNTVNKKEDGSAPPLPNFIAESMHMICLKIARIANGNIYHADSWVDIAGYATLVANILNEAEQRGIQKAAELEKVAAQKSVKEESVSPPSHLNLSDGA